MLYFIQVKKGKIPNFDQFVDFVLSLKSQPQLDAHLEFYWRKCDMCNIAYDIIGKTETSTKDMEYINEKVMMHYCQEALKRLFTLSSKAFWQ